MSDFFLIYSDNDIFYSGSGNQKFILGAAKKMCYSGSEKKLGLFWERPKKSTILGVVFFMLGVTIDHDIAFSTKECSRHMQNPGKKHMAAVNRIIKYLVSTKDLKKRFTCVKPLVDDFIALVDSNFAGSWDARSTSSAAVIANGAPLVHIACSLEL